MAHASALWEDSLRALRFAMMLLRPLVLVYGAKFIDFLLKARPMTSERFPMASLQAQSVMVGPPKLTKTTSGVPRPCERLP